jgi:hypothetical protein
MKDTSKKAGRVTIGIPTYNRSAFAVRAVRSALGQTYKDVEVVVSDNASADDTVQRLKEVHDPRLVLLEQPQNVGMVGNFNVCLRAATGEFFLLLSDDDILEPTAIERLYAPFRAPPNDLAPSAIGVSWSPCYIINAEGHCLWTSDGGPEIESSISFILGQFNGDRGARFCGIMVRTDDAISVEGYDENRYGPLCDMGSWTRIALQYQHVVCIKEPLASYTMHQASGTSQAAVHDWQRFAQNLNEDLRELINARADAVSQRQFEIACKNHVSNGIATILLQALGKPGQVPRIVREIINWRTYLLTWYVAKRIFRDGWKLLRLRQRKTSKTRKRSHAVV